MQLKNVVLAVALALPVGAQIAAYTTPPPTGTVPQGWAGVFAGRSLVEFCAATQLPGNTQNYSYSCYASVLQKGKPLTATGETGVALYVGQLQTKIGKASLFVLGTAGSSLNTALSLALSTGALMVFTIKDGWTAQAAVEWQKVEGVPTTVYKAGIGVQWGGKK